MTTVLTPPPPYFVRTNGTGTVLRHPFVLPSRTWTQTPRFPPTHGGSTMVLRNPESGVRHSTPSTMVGEDSYWSPGGHDKEDGPSETGDGERVQWVNEGFINGSRMSHGSWVLIDVCPPVAGPEVAE